MQFEIKEKEIAMKNKYSEGYIYLQKSPNFDCIKIGGTGYPPMKRIKEINSTDPYKTIGPWSLADFRQVRDWRKIEYNLHYSFRQKLNKTIKKQKELFQVSIQTASKLLHKLDEGEIINKPKIGSLNS